MSIHLSITISCPSGRVAQVRRSINSLFYQSFDFNSVELLFLNDGGEPELYNILKSYSGKFTIRYFHLAHKSNDVVSSSGRRNFLIRQAKGEYILLADPEIVHCSQTISQTMNSFFKFGDKIWYCGRVYGTKSFSDNKGNFTNLITKTVQKEEFCCLGNEPKPNIAIDLDFFKNSSSYNYINEKKYEVLMFCTATSKKYLEKVRGFNEKMKVWGFDDVDLYYRLKEIGIKRIFDKKFIVYHLPHKIKTPLEKRISWNLYNTNIAFTNDANWGYLKNEVITESILK